MKNYWLYVLKLEKDKYYVGITSKTPEVRMQQHLNGFMAAKWVQKYRPIEIAESVELGEIPLHDAQQREKAYTLLYMKKYGYQNVRGADLNYSGKYVKLGNRYFRDRDFEVLATVTLLLIIIGGLVWRS